MERHPAGLRRDTHRGPCRKSRAIRMVLLLALVAIAGCSNRAWYGGLQSSERMRCQQLASPEYEECLEASGTGYDEYKQEREEISTEE